MLLTIVSNVQQRGERSLTSPTKSMIGVESAGIFPAVPGCQGEVKLEMIRYFVSYDRLDQARLQTGK